MAMNFESLEECLDKYLPEDELKEVKRLLYGTVNNVLHEIPENAQQIADDHDFEIKSCFFTAQPEHLRESRIVRIGAIQNTIYRPTTHPLELQSMAIYERVSKMIDAAAEANVNILCMPEAWSIPFALCTREKLPWCEFAESVEHGATTKFVQEFAQKYNMVIISPILERDTDHGDIMWNTAVVISNDGTILGKHRKNHIPKLSDCNESLYYHEGNTGHPVFDTEFGKIAINICYGRHHPQNWMMFGLNGAEIVFNPSAVGVTSEPLWGIEARNAAIANSYFTVAVNRVGFEEFPKTTRRFVLEDDQSNSISNNYIDEFGRRETIDVNRIGFKEFSETGFILEDDQPNSMSNNYIDEFHRMEARDSVMRNNNLGIVTSNSGCDEDFDENKFILNDSTVESDESSDPFCGSSYITSPDGSRTPGLSRTKDGLLIAEVDLNLCRQMKDHWGFRMTQRLPLYARSFVAAARSDFKPQIIK